MTSDDPPLSTVGDRFRVAERIGSGGFATVWRAVDERGGPDVAVKFPRTNGNGSNDVDDVVPRFRTECSVLERFADGLRPPALVGYVDGSESEPMYLVTEYVDGPDLTERLADGPPDPGTAAVDRFGVPVIRALEFLHWNGVCYLDCKPENVLVRRGTDAPLLVDFNAAEPADSADTLFYEDAYKAPEQTPDGDRDADPGPRSDVYAAGKLLHYLLTGETLSTGETPSRGVDPSDVDAGVPTALARVVRRATRADPAERPADATELITALREARDEPTAVAELRDARTGVACPVRPGQTVGRATREGDDPSVEIDDGGQYLSPVHFALDRDGESWLVRDRSLNGTYIEAGGDWEMLLCPEGVDRLREEAPESVPEDPYRAGRIRGETAVAPVDPEYRRLVVDPDPARPR